MDQGNFIDKDRKEKLSSKTYDLYAPLVYTSILHRVPAGPIANKILEKVFVNAFTSKNKTSFTIHVPLVSLMNASREKSNLTMRALEIFRECCAGTTISINSANSKKNTQDR